MNSELIAKLEDHYAAAQAASQAPDLAYAVAFGSEVVAASNTKTKFRIASMSKSFTAAAVLLLRDRGALQLDAPIATLVPELRDLTGPTGDGAAITVRHLLTMSSGLPTDDPWGDRLLDVSEEELNELFRQPAFFAAPTGSTYIYSNYGYAMLGRAITNASGQPFAEFIAHELLAPLGMNDTGYDIPESGHALPFRVRDGQVIPDEPAALAHGGFGAMGGIWSTVDDLLKWIAFFVDAFPARNGTDDAPLSRASRREMQQSCTAFASEGKRWGGYGMGLRVLHDPALGLCVSHSGGLPGYGSNMTWYPDHRVAVVSLANITYAPMYRVNDESMRSLQDAKVFPFRSSTLSVVLTEFADRLLELLLHWDNNAADRLFSFNVALDEPYHRRKKAVEKLISPGQPYRLESLTEISGAQAEVQLIGLKDGPQFTLKFSLGPQEPPRIESFSLTLTSV